MDDITRQRLIKERETSMREYDEAIDDAAVAQLEHRSALLEATGLLCQTLQRGYNETKQCVPGLGEPDHDVIHAMASGLTHQAIHERLHDLMDQGDDDDEDDAG